jgi:hypothetical protein
VLTNALVPLAIDWWRGSNRLYPTPAQLRRQRWAVVALFPCGCVLVAGLLLLPSWAHVLLFPVLSIVLLFGTELAPGRRFKLPLLRQRSDRSRPSCELRGSPPECA